MVATVDMDLLDQELLEDIRAQQCDDSEMMTLPMALSESSDDDWQNGEPPPGHAGPPPPEGWYHGKIETLGMFESEKVFDKWFTDGSSDGLEEDAEGRKAVLKINYLSSCNLHYIPYFVETRDEPKERWVLVASFEVANWRYEIQAEVCDFQMYVRKQGSSSSWELLSADESVAGLGALLGRESGTMDFAEHNKDPSGHTTRYGCEFKADFERNDFRLELTPRHIYKKVQV